MTQVADQMGTLKNELPLALRAAYLAMHRRSDARFDKYGVTADQFVLLAALADGEALTQRELANRMSSDPSTVRGMLGLLENQGFVRRAPHPTDSRARTAALTAAGRRKYKQLWRAGESIRTAMVETLPAKDVAYLIQMLGQLAEALGQNKLQDAKT